MREDKQPFNVIEYLSRKGFDPKYPNAGDSKCPKCDTPMEYRVIYNFGDPNMGVREDWYQCPYCNYKEPIR